MKKQTKAEYLAAKPAPTKLKRDPIGPGMVTKMSEEMFGSGGYVRGRLNRRNRRREAKSFLHDPIAYQERQLKAQKAAKEAAANKSIFQKLSEFFSGEKTDKS